MNTINNIPPAVASEVRVYKDNWLPSQPWTADLVLTDGQVWKKWQYGYKTLKDLKMVTEAVTAAPITRRKDMDK